MARLSDIQEDTERKRQNLRKEIKTLRGYGHDRENIWKWLYADHCCTSNPYERLDPEWVNAELSAAMIDMGRGKL